MSLLVKHRTGPKIVSVEIEGLQLPFSVYRVARRLPEGECYVVVSRIGRQASTIAPILTSCMTDGVANPWAIELRLKNHSGMGYWFWSDGPVASVYPTRRWKCLRWEEVPPLWQGFLLNVMLEEADQWRHNAEPPSVAALNHYIGIADKTLLAMRKWLERAPIEYTGMDWDDLACRPSIAVSCHRVADWLLPETRERHNAQQREWRTPTETSVQGKEV